MTTVGKALYAVYNEKLTDSTQSGRSQLALGYLPGAGFRIRIQLVYDNSFRSIWEYEEAFYREKVDWQSAAGEVCPLCGRIGCYREISPYHRSVIELFPFREGKVPIRRFQCREKMRTFSLLPHQLAPYHKYTIESMILSVLIWCEFHREAGVGASLAVEELPGDCQVTPWLLRRWLGIVLTGFHGGHSILCAWYDLSGIRSGENLPEMIYEVYSYYHGLVPRGPPSRMALRGMVQRYSKATGRHLLGIPSQERSRLSAR